uniref:ARAD1D05192p n=1 Tax=Blastobotrys adeninivorans TaxID=409370 RepID=A0A060T7S0_BLAAD
MTSLKLMLQMAIHMIKFRARELLEQCRGYLHRLTYTPGPNPRKIVIVGGSYGGWRTAKLLANRIPSGYSITLIEKNKHHNHTFVFPRYCVYGGNETQAFIPREHSDLDFAPKGAFEMVFGECTSVSHTEKNSSYKVTLNDGTEIDASYLVVATGVHAPIPTQLKDQTRDGGIAELQSVQQKIADSSIIAVIGAGAAGVELATDIKYRYGSEKQVVLYNSRAHVLPRFPEQVHEMAEVEILNLGVELVHKTRPTIIDEHTLELPDGTTRKFDAVFNCTGGRAASGPFEKLLGNVIDPKSGQILVKSSLQVDDSSLSNVFALGDVAGTHGPKMGRAAFSQANVVVENIVRDIYKRPMLTYTPAPVENALLLTLGLSKSLLHMGNTYEMKEHPEDPSMGAKRIWTFFDVDYDRVMGEKSG